MSTTTPYRTYLNKSLTRLELSHINNSAPENMKYCNFLCQEYVSITDFAKKGKNLGMFCKKCINYYNLVIKQVKDKTITVEQFKENPNIVYGNEVISISTKKCKSCKQDKSIDLFEVDRQKCKECRQLEASKRNNNIGTYITDIDSKKNNPGELEKVVKLIPKDKLIQIISHYEVGRKSSDTKDIMVKNVVDHFTKLLDPWICRGRCGNKLTIQFHTCDGCIRKIVSTKRTIEEFKEKILPEFIEKLEVITEADEHNFNKEELNTICKELKLPVKQKMTKEVVLKLINDEVKILKEQREKQKFLQENNLLFETPKKNGEICLNGIMVLSREDCYINATQLCRAGGKKKFNDWCRLDSTKELIKTLEEDLKFTETGYPASGLLDIIKVS